jgi:hypothetical protein
MDHDQFTTQTLEANGYARYGIGIYSDLRAQQVAWQLQDKGWPAQKVPTGYEAAGQMLYAVYWKKA